MGWKHEEGLNPAGMEEEEEGADCNGSSQPAGVAAVLFSPATVASIYCLAWSMSYIVFPFAIWSCKAQPLPNTY